MEELNFEGPRLWFLSFRTFPEKGMEVSMINLKINKLLGIFEAQSLYFYVCRCLIAYLSMHTWRIVTVVKIQAWECKTR